MEEKKKWVFGLRMTLFILIISFQAVFIFIIVRFAQIAEYTSINWKWIPAMFVCLCVLADIMLYFSIVHLQKRKQIEARNAMLNSELKKQLEHYEHVVEHLENTAKFRHDFRNYMQIVYVLIERESYDEAKEMLDNMREKVQVEVL